MSIGGVILIGILCFLGGGMCGVVAMAIAVAQRRNEDEDDY